MFSLLQTITEPVGSEVLVRLYQAATIVERRRGGSDILSVILIAM